MPNKSHRSINELASGTEEPAFLSVLILGGLAALIAGLVMLSGGLTSPIVALVILFPVLVGQLVSLRAARSAVLYAVAMFGLLGVMQMARVIPPSVPLFESIAGWALATAIVVSVLLFLWQRDRETASVEHDMDAPQISPEHESLPLLLIQVSEHGRIRSLYGNEALLVGVTVGREIAPLLSITEQRPVLDIPDGKLRLLVFTSSVAGSPRVDSETYLDDVAGLGHDLKSPLNAILGFANMMENEAENLPERLRDYPGFVSDAGQTLLGRVEQLLDLAKAESGALSLEPQLVNLFPLVQDTVAGLSGIADAAGVRFDFKGAEACSAFVDYNATVRIVENLVTNAVKYAETGGKIDILVQPDGAWARLTVRDRGTGIGADDLQRIGEPFTQASHTNGREGAGLGLALVKKLVALQEGEFRIRTAQGRGTQMIVRLPATAA